MPKLILATLALLFISACSQPSAPVDDVLAIRCGNLVDGLSDEALGARLVVIRNERIESVEARAGWTCPTTPACLASSTHTLISP